MTDQKFNIVFAGDLQPEQDASAVRSRLAKLFKTDEQRIAALFDGNRHIVKRGADAETAERYVQAMAKSGAIAHAEEIEQAAKPVTAPVAPADTAVSDTPDETSKVVPATEPVGGEFVVAPVGADLLNEDERPHVTPVEVAVDHLKLESPFLAQEIERTPPPPAPDTSHIQLAEQGANLAPRDDQLPPPAPDTSRISLAEQGGLLIEPSEESTVAVPDVSSIELSPPGAPLDESREEKPPVQVDTSRLSLAPETNT